MHRELSHADNAFASESRLSLYLLTALLGLLIGLDLWPVAAAWISGLGLALPTWPRTLGGYQLALIPAILGGARVLYGSLERLLEGKLGADLALALACVAAILLGEPLVAAEVVFIGILGECLESWTFERTQRAIRTIVEICPRRCWLLREGQEVRVFVNELQVGDRVVVKPGARVPADGVVLDGRSAVDVSALTGESLPAEKGPGDEVLAGSLNQFGALTIEARRVAEQTVVGRVIELTARALKDKANVERTADRLARYFLPTVLGLALVTFLGAMLYHGTALFRPADAVRLSFGEAARLSLYPTLAVLVVACPCALILATPAAIIAALGRLAGTGVLLKGGSALERLAVVTAFAFDKTGTLTEGRLELGDVTPLSGVAADDLLRAAACAEQRSEHVLARLILHEAARRSLTLEPVEEFLAHPGAGVTVRTSEATVLVGTRRLLEEQGIPLPPEALALLEQLDATGQTALLVARNGSLLGVLGARDRVRPEARVVLAELRALGITNIALLTGDRPAAAQAVARELGIEEVHAELLPEQKARFLEQWQHSAPREEPTAALPPEMAIQSTETRLRIDQQRTTGSRRRVAMVGDGINDAPALARADVGLALGGTGTDVAAEAGDVVFMGDPLRHLPLLVRLSRETVKIIHQNIVIFAFGVNIVGVVLTAWLWPLFAPAKWYDQSPIVAVIYHQIGSLAVLVNAMRLLWFERPAAQRRWAQGKRALDAVDRWLQHYGNLDEGLHWLGHRWKPAAAAAVVLALLGYALSGLTQVNADEVAVVRRFGRPLPDDLGPGLSWRWPWPIEQVSRVQKDRIQTVEVGFRSFSGNDLLPGALSWSSSHGDNLARVPDEAVMIAADGDLVELQATVRYRVADVRTYLFKVNQVDDLLRAATEAILRDTVATRVSSRLMTADRQRFQQEVLDRLRTRCREYDLGIELDGLAVHDLHPPPEVVQAYHEVTRAMEDHDKVINDALADASRQTHSAEAEGHQIELEARAARDAAVGQKEVELASFLGWHAQRTQLSFAQEWHLLSEAALAVQQGRAAPDAAREYVQRRHQWLAAQPALVDFRLALDAVAQGLGPRRKMFVIADGTALRSLRVWLFDFNRMVAPPPAAVPDRAPFSRSPRPSD